MHHLKRRSLPRNVTAVAAQDPIAASNRQHGRGHSSARKASSPRPFTIVSAVATRSETYVPFRPFGVSYPPRLFPSSRIEFLMSVTAQSPRATVDSMSGTNPFEDPLRFERAVPECAIVIFGANGDLARRKLMPSLYRLAYNRRANLPPATEYSLLREELRIERPDPVFERTLARAKVL